MKRRFALAALLMLSVLMAAPLVRAQAQPVSPSAAATPSGLPWAALSSQQQTLLGSMQGRWDALPPERQQALANGASRWLSMTPDQRVAARQRFQNWQRLPPAERAAMRQRWQRFQRLSPDQQQAIRQNFRAFSRLPPAERQQLRQRWINATPAQRADMLRAQRAQRFGAPRFHPHSREWRGIRP